MDQRRPAGEAGEIAASVDAMGVGGGAGAAQGIDVIAEGAATLGDGGLEDVADACCEGVPVAWREVTSGRERVKAGEEEGFIGVDVADAGEHGLVEEDGLDGAGGGCGGLMELMALDGERVGAEVVPCDGVEIEAGGQWAKPAEAARVAEEHGVAAIDGPQGVHMRVDGDVGGIGEEEDLAAHAELDDEGAAVGGDEGELLAATFDGGDGGVLEKAVGAIAGGAGCGRADIGAEELGAADEAADQTRLEGAAERFDFGEFWHGVGEGLPRGW